MASSTRKLTLEARFSDKMSRPAKKATDKTSKAFLGLAKSVAVPIASFLTLSAIARKGLEFTKLAAEAQGVAIAFDNLAKLSGRTADVFANELRQAARGTISDLELMKKANEAALLAGENIIKDLPQLIEIARASAAATGQSVEFLFQSIVLGIGRQSKLILDNLGIIVSVDKANAEYAITLGKQSSALTEAEKKQAFLNAVMKSGQDIIRDTGNQQDLATDASARLTAQTQNLALAIGEELLPAVNRFREILVLELKSILDLIRSNSDLNVALREQDVLIQDQTRLREQLRQEQERGGNPQLQAELIDILSDAIRRNSEELKANVALVKELRGISDEDEAGDEEEAPVAEDDFQVLLQQQITELLFTEAQRRAFLISEIETLEGEARLQRIKQLAELEVAIIKSKNQRIIDFTLRQSQLLEQVGQAAGAGQQAIGRKFAIGQIQILQQTASEALKIQQVQAVGEALKSAPPPANFVAAALVAGKFALLRAAVGVAGGAAISAISGGGPQQQESQAAPGGGGGGASGIITADRRVPDATAPEGGTDVQQLNLTIQALDPETVDWDKVFQDNLKPALQDAVDREVTLNVGEI